MPASAVAELGFVRRLSRNHTMKSFAILLIFLGMAATHGQTTSPPPKAPTAEIVFILGEIRAPQILAYTPDLTLHGAISAAGGISDFAATDIYIIRGGAIFLKTTTRDLRRKTPAGDPKLKPKDIVYLGSIANAQ